MADATAPLFALVYASVAEQKFTEEELLALLAEARAKNAPLGITGLLLYHDGSFLQLLEGPEDVVRALYEKIEHDPRHFRTEILAQEPIAERAFPDWAMGFKNVGQLTAEQVEGYSDFLDQNFNLEHFRQARRRSLMFLLSFRRTIRG